MDTKNLYYVDFHTHYENENKTKLKEVFNNNNIISLTNNINLDTYPKLRHIQEEKINNLYFAYGFYPDVVLNKNYNLEEYISKIDFTKGSAIGEIGIDYKITKDKILREEQKKLLIKQLEIAEELKKPVIIHSRFATKRVLEILDSFDKLKVILHWFNGTNEEILKAFDKNYYLTLNYDRNKIQDLKPYLKQIFIETDYPIPYNNLEQNILNIKEAYKVVSKIYNIDENILKKEIKNNFYKLFPKED